MLKPILIGLPLLCAKVGVLARTGEIRAAPTPALTWRRVMRWVMVFLTNNLGLCRRDARAGPERGSTLSKIQELSANKIHLDHPRTCASSAVQKMSGNRSRSTLELLARRRHQSLPLTSQKSAVSARNS